MEASRGSESDSDFASAESDNEEVQLSAKPSPPNNPPTTPPQQPPVAADVSDSPADQEKDRLTPSPVTEPLLTEETGVDDTEDVPGPVDNECSKDAINRQTEDEPPVAQDGVAVVDPAVTLSAVTGEEEEVEAGSASDSVEQVGPPITTEPKTNPVTTNTAPMAEATTTTPQQLQDPAPPPASGWGWGWGSVWSSVSNITESAGKGFTSVISSVEESLGIPSPDTVAMGDQEEGIASKLADEAVEHDTAPQQQGQVYKADLVIPGAPEQMARDSPDPVATKPSADQSSGFWDSLGLGNIASSVQSTSAGLVAGSLGALETLGKKTMDILSEGDPGLRKKRLLLGGKSTTLSELLKEAKLESETAIGSDPQGGHGTVGQTIISFSIMFDEYQGVVHLEALELLSSECTSKVTSEQDNVEDEYRDKLNKLLAELNEAFKIEENDEDTEELLATLLLELPGPAKTDKLTKTIQTWKDQVTSVNEDEAQIEVLYERGMRSLADTTSVTIDLFRKMAELSLLPDASTIDIVEKATKCNRFTVLVSSELESLASLYAQQLVAKDKEESSATVTSLYLEASNSSSYIQDAFQLLLPVLQYNCLQQVINSQHQQ